MNTWLYTLGGGIVLWILIHYLCAIGDTHLFGKKRVKALTPDQLPTPRNPPLDSSLIGKTGTSDTRLNPAGFALIDGVRYDALSEAGYIEQGTDIRIVEIRGNNIIIEKK